MGRKSVQFFFLILLEIDLEWIEMAFKWFRMPSNPFLGDFDAFLSGFGGCTPHFSRLFGPIKRPKEAKLGQIWAKKGFSRGLTEGG